MRRGLQLLIAIVPGLVVAAGCGGGGPAGSPAPTGPAFEAGSPLGEAPALVGEPAERPDLSSPEMVIRSILAGRAREDLSFLARCDAETAGKQRLDRMDEHRAWRYYCMEAMKPFWNKIEGSLQSGGARFTVDGDRATGAFEVGGALGVLELPFVRVAGEWYLRFDGSSR